MSKMIIAVDPGASGCIAIRWHGGSVTAVKMPDTEGDVVAEIHDAVESAQLEGCGIVAVVEKVGGYVSGGGGQPGSAMFRFGYGAGVIMGALLALRVPTIMVTPQKWQGRLGIGTRGKREKGEWKNVLKAEAQRRYPDQKVTLATADGLLILDWAVENVNGGQ